MPRPPSPHLTEAEQRIMTVMWAREEATVQEVTEALKSEHGLAYTTVLTTMRIMAEKGHLGFRKEGRAHVYRALIKQAGVRRRALRSLLGSLFDGSPRSLAQHLIDHEKLTLADIEELRKRLLDQQKGGGR
jgi:BlaI family transcriptional regulator, penicillinase repressor